MLSISGWSIQYVYLSSASMPVSSFVIMGIMFCLSQHPSIYRVGHNLRGFGRFNVYCSLIWIGIFPRVNPIQKFLTHYVPFNPFVLRSGVFSNRCFNNSLPIIWLACCAHMQSCVFSLILISDCFFFFQKKIFFEDLCHPALCCFELMF